MQVIVVDRSRIEARQKCPRLRYWQYEYAGTGLQGVRRSAALEIGSAVHEGIAQLASEVEVEAAVAEAVSYLRTEAMQGLYDISGVQEDLEEAAALVEALVRAWAAVRLPWWLENFEFLEVEREEMVPLEVDMVLLTRSDAVVKRRGDGTKFLVNWKTAKQCDQRWRDQFRYDQQTLSELLPVEARLSEKLGGVIIEGLVKGGKPQAWAEKKVAGELVPTYQSPLIWPWKKSGEAPFTADELSGRWDWVDTDGKNRRLGKGWSRVPIWKEPGGVKAWIEKLMATDRGLVADQFVSLEPILRSDWEIDEWQRATVVSEREVRAHVLEVEQNPELLPVLFQKHTGHGNCLWPSQCAMKEICWGVIADDPIGSGLFEKRVPNHPLEEKLNAVPRV